MSTSLFVANPAYKTRGTKRFNQIPFIAAIGDGGDHGWEGDFGKEVRGEDERRRARTA
jgi:hypothetical protein